MRISTIGPWEKPIEIWDLSGEFVSPCDCNKGISWKDPQECWVGTCCNVPANKTDARDKMRHWWSLNSGIRGSSLFFHIFPTKIAIWEYTSSFETNQSRNTNSCSSSFQMVQVHFVSIGNVSPLADVQNIWTAVAKARCHRERKDEQTEQTWTDIICGATNKSTASHMFKAPTSRFFLGMTRVLIIVEFVDWTAHLWRRNEYCSLSAGARCQHAGAHSEGLRICPKMSKTIFGDARF